MQVLAGAIEWVDNPYMLVIADRPAFFAKKCVLRVKAFNFPYNFCFAGFVYFTDVIMAGFAFNGNGVHVLHLPAHNFGGGVGGFDSHIEYRMRHVR